MPSAQNNQAPNAANAVQQRRAKAAEEAERKKEEQERQRQEKMEADRLAKEEEERVKNDREKKKQERAAAERKKKDEEKKKKEEEKKRKAEEKKKKVEEAKANADKPDDNINAHLNDINNVGGEDEDMATEERKEEDSPVKKRGRKDKKKDKKDKKKEAKDQAKVTKTFATAAKATVTPLSRDGKFSKDAVSTKKREEMAMYLHKHVRWLAELSILLEAHDKYAEFTNAVRALFENVLEVDPTAVIEPVVEGKGMKLLVPKDISYNHTKMGAHVNVQAGEKTFEKKKPWRKGGGDGEDVELVDPTVYFTIAFSTDEEPEEIMRRIWGEWGKMKGQRMRMKDIASFGTETPLVIYHMLAVGHQQTLINELTKILEKARDDTAMDVMEDDFEYADTPIPQFGLRLAVPKVPGQDTKLFEKWTNRQNFCRKALHIECDRKHSALLKILVGLGKRKTVRGCCVAKQVQCRYNR